MAGLFLDDRGNVTLIEGVKPRKIDTPVPDSLESARRWDAVRDAAREFEDLSVQDLRERLRGVTTRELLLGDLERFQVDVRAQMLDDLVDALDQRHRGSLRARRRVRLAMPRGYERKALAGLGDDETDGVRMRLKARGWSDMDVVRVGHRHST